MGKFSEVAAEIGALVTAKNEAYGNSFAKCGDFLRLLWPNGIAPEQYGDALAMVRIFDKQMRVATAKDALGESPYRDIAGYGILGAVKDARGALATAAAHKAPSLCDDCRNVHECKLFDKGIRVTLCEEHRPSLCDSEVEKASGCDGCVTFGSRCGYRFCRHVAGQQP